jgi:ParB-like nuclease domain
MNTAEIPLDQIAANPDAQMRVVGIDPDTVVAYAEDMRAGATFPPIKVFYDGARYDPSDGWHRIDAARRVERTTILAEVLEGTSRDATLAACAANAAHGLRRSNDDKRRAILAMLRDPEWSTWSDRKIALACLVDHKSVAKVRRELTAPKSNGGDFPTSASVAPKAGNGVDASGSMVERLLATVPLAALLAELRRRGVEMPDA